MNRALGNTLFVLAIVFVPLLLGYAIIGPKTPVGRNSRSTTRVGHKALFLLFEELGYDVRRFERGVETLPDRPAALIALEPGPSLFRERGAFAKNLIRWIERGNAALVTLGPDPDALAELDDDPGELGAKARRAIELAESIREEARERAAEAPGEAEPERARDVTSIDGRELDPNESWDSAELTELLELPLLEDRLETSRSSSVALNGPLAAELGTDPSIAITRPRVWLPHALSVHEREYRVLLSAQDRPLLIELDLGRGRLLVLTEPRLFHNAAIARAAHARIAVRAVERLFEVSGPGVLLFEEFSHGGREAESAIDLAFQTRARWTVLQLLLAMLVWIATVVGRNRSIVPFESAPRRSRDEVIDAMASLFLRASDTRGAARRLIELSKRRLLGTLPIGAETELIPLLAARLRRDPRDLEAVFDPKSVRTAKDLMERAGALRELRVAAEAQR